MQKHNPDHPHRILTVGGNNQEVDTDKIFFCILRIHMSGRIKF